MIERYDELNHKTAYTYDKVGNTLTVTDPRGNVTAYTYNAYNQIATVTYADGGMVGYAYNVLARLESVTDQRSNVTSYTYDALGRTKTVTDAENHVTEYFYDAVGNVTKTQIDGHTVSRSEYDDLYRVTKAYDGNDEAAQYAYDKVGNLTSAADATGTVSFTYDALYRATQVNDNGAVIGYAYNTASQRTGITYPDGKTVTTTYDVLGNVASLTDHDGSGVTYTRDAEGRVIKENHSDGSTTEYDYNKAGQLVEQKEVTAQNATRRKILYGYDDAGNLTSESRAGVDFDRRDESVRYSYDKDNRLTSTVVEGKTTAYTYDLAGNLLSDGEATYTYDAQNRLLTKTGANGTITYKYDAAGNLVKETNPDGTVSYTYNAQNKLVKGELSDGQSSTYAYNALGARIENEQVRANENRGYQNADLTDGSHGTNYLDFLKDGRAAWQRAWESEVGTVYQNDFETVTRHYVVDYLSAANRDLIATEDGSYVTRYVYDENSIRISAEFDYADGTQRGATNANGEYGENPQSDFAAERGKVWYRWSHLGSTLFAVDASGEVVAHMVYDAWGNPLVDTYPDANFSGLENLNNYTGYTYDETLNLYFAQNRFYDAENHRFTQEDSVKDGANWYVYCGNNPMNYVDPWGYYYVVKDSSSRKYIAVPASGAAAVLSSLAAIFPKYGGVISLGIEGTEGILLRQAVGGSSKHYVKSVGEFIGGSALEKIATETIGEKNTQFGFGLFGALSFWDNLDKKRNDLQTDEAAFCLFALANISPKADTVEEVEFMMECAVAYAMANRWFFIDSTHQTCSKNSAGGINYANYSSAFMNLMTLQNMEKSGKSKNEINGQINEYWHPFCCEVRNNRLMTNIIYSNGKLANAKCTYTANIQKPPYAPVYASVTGYFYEYALNHYNEVLSGIKSDFTNYICQMLNAYRGSKANAK